MALHYVGMCWITVILRHCNPAHNYMLKMAILGVGSHVATSIQEDCGSHYTQTVVCSLSSLMSQGLYWRCWLGWSHSQTSDPGHDTMLEWASIYVHMYSRKLHMGTGRCLYSDVGNGI